MITAKQKKFVAALAEAKHRRREGLFTAEGTKCVSDTAGAFTCRALYATESWLAENSAVVSRLAPQAVEPCGMADLRLMTTMIATPAVIAVYELPPVPIFDPTMPDRELLVALDRLQDPGNLGTVMRTADWFGVTTILASTDTVDAFNPKAIQASMGAVARVRVIYGDLPRMLAQVKAPIFGTFLDGSDIYATELASNGIIVMGNEGRGISPEVATCVTRRLLIPSFPPDRPTSESLNVAAATAITLSTFRHPHL